MPGKKRERTYLIGIFLCAFFLRMFAFVYLPERPITDDAYDYNFIAQHIGKALQNEKLEDRDTFLYLGAKRGWLYPSFIAVVYGIFGYHPRNVLLLQALIDSFTCILIYAIGREIFSGKVGTIAAFISALYPAFFYYANMLFQETTTIFLLTLYTLLLCRAISQKKPLLYFISGMLITVISFYRSGFIFFLLFTTPLLFFILWFFYRKEVFPSVLRFCTGALCMIILYGAFSYRVSGAFTLNKPSIAWSIYETAHRDGWVSDTFTPTPTKELRAVAEDHSYSLSSDNHQLGLPPKVYLLATIRYISNNPLGYFSQLITRCKRMWMFVETYPGRWHDTGVWGQLMFHRALIILALVGIPLSLTVWHQSWLFISLFFYVTIFFIPTIGLPRYAVPAMPFVIILAAHTLLSLFNSFRTRGNQLQTLRFITYVIVICLLSLVVYYLDVPMLLSVVPNGSPSLLYTTTIVGMNLLILTIAVFLCRILMLNFSVTGSVYTIIFPLSMVLLVYNNAAFTSKTWHEWQCPLTSPHQKIRHTLLLPDDFNSDNYRSATLLIDLFPGRDQNYNFHVEFDGEPIKRYDGGIKAREKKFENKFFGLYKKLFFDTYKLTPEDLRQWYEIEVPLQNFKDKTQLVIECFLTGTSNQENDYVLLFGDYTTLGNNAFQGPGIPRSDADTSMIKVMPYTGDYRFEKVTQLSSKKTISEHYNGREWQKEDLSRVRGVQSGSYRVRIQLISKDGSQVIL
jgi:4-amino-4-deoxy-L-arabinose transferase-like glycosyltransferase